MFWTQIPAALSHTATCTAAGQVSLTVLWGLSLTPREIQFGRDLRRSPVQLQITAGLARISEEVIQSGLYLAKSKAWGCWSCPGSWADACLFYSHQVVPPWHRIMQGQPLTNRTPDVCSLQQGRKSDASVSFYPFQLLNIHDLQTIPKLWSNLQREHTLEQIIPHYTNTVSMLNLMEQTWIKYSTYQVVRHKKPNILPTNPSTALVPGLRLPIKTLVFMGVLI